MAEKVVAVSVYVSLLLLLLLYDMTLLVVGWLGGS